MKVTSPVLPGENVEGLEVNVGADQPEYLTAPTIFSDDGTFCATSRIKLSWAERLTIFLGGSLWIQRLTFGHPTQPFRLLFEQPSVLDCLYLGTGTEPDVPRALDLPDTLEPCGDDNATTA